MKKTYSVSKIMIKHHYKIDRLLHQFKNEIDQENKDLTEIYNKFKWELEKHFFLEEKAIFQLHYSKNEESNKIKDKLKKEHDELLEKLGEIGENIKNKKKVDFFEFRKLLLKHKDFENVTFYPRLDNELDDSRKKMICERLSNPI